MAAKRPMSGRGAGGNGKSIDARQKIGATDVRQRLGGGGAGFQAKDAQEKLAQKDARLKIRGKGGAGFQRKDAREKLALKDACLKIRGKEGAGGVQDARRIISSRKQEQSGVPAQTTQKIEVTQQLQDQTPVPQTQIQASNNLASLNARQFSPNVHGQSVRAGATPQPSNNKTVKDARNGLRLKRRIGGTEAAGAPPLKMTKTSHQHPVGVDGTRAADASTAPRPPVPVAFTRPNTIVAATRFSAAALKQFSRTLQQSTAETSTTAPVPAQHAFSPLQGTKITVDNLHPQVTYADIIELFCVYGALKQARQLKVGMAEVVFVRKEDAVRAFRSYNNRCLDDQPMKLSLHIQGNVITSDESILLRLSDNSDASSGTKKDGLPSSLSRPDGQRASTQPTVVVDRETILKALFKSTSSEDTTFFVKL